MCSICLIRRANTLSYFSSIYNSIFLLSSRCSSDSRLLLGTFGLFVDSTFRFSKRVEFRTNLDEGVDVLRVLSIAVDMALSSCLLDFLV